MMKVARGTTIVYRGVDAGYVRGLFGLRVIVVPSASLEGFPIVCLARACRTIAVRKRNVLFCVLPGRVVGQFVRGYDIYISSSFQGRSKGHGNRGPLLFYGPRSLYVYHFKGVDYLV